MGGVLHQCPCTCVSIVLRYGSVGGNVCRRGIGQMETRSCIHRAGVPRLFSVLSDKPPRSVRSLPLPPFFAHSRPNGSSVAELFRHWLAASCRIDASLAARSFLRRSCSSLVMNGPVPVPPGDTFVVPVPSGPDESPRSRPKRGKGCSSPSTSARSRSAWSSIDAWIASASWCSRGVIDLDWWWKGPRMLARSGELCRRRCPRSLSLPGSHCCLPSELLPRYANASCPCRDTSS
jgi:hypothetical protein